MKLAHWANACLWLANALTWALFAGSKSMALLSLCAVGLAVYLAVTSDNYWTRSKR